MGTSRQRPSVTILLQVAPVVPSTVADRLLANFKHLPLRPRNIGVEVYRQAPVTSTRVVFPATCLVLAPLHLIGRTLVVVWVLPMTVLITRGQEVWGNAPRLRKGLKGLPTSTILFYRCYSTQQQQVWKKRVLFKTCLPRSLPVTLFRPVNKWPTVRTRPQRSDYCIDVYSSTLRAPSPNKLLHLVPQQLPRDGIIRLLNYGTQQCEVSPIKVTAAGIQAEKLPPTPSH